ncbi:MAG: hypothetical protein GYA21_06540 [Myxococcales bacterium]|nr:hypothetical protein [Myxococcales bacterium]
MLTLALCLVLPMALLAPCTECEKRAAARAAEEGGDEPPRDPELPGETESTALKTARAFVSAMGSEQDEALSALCGDPFNFDGRVVSGREEILRHLRLALAPQRESLGGKQKIDIEILTLSQATERFGPPPKKFAGAFPAGAVFAAVTFERRPGFLLVIVRKKADWKIIGIAE